MTNNVAESRLQCFKTVCIDQHIEYIVLDVMTERMRVMIDAIRTFVGRGHDHGDRLAFGPTEPGLAEHQRHIQVEMVAQRLRVETMNAENVGDLAALLHQLRIHFFQLSVGFTNVNFVDPGHCSSS